MTEIIRYESSMAARWNEFVRQSRNGTLLHERGYMDYHSDRFTDCSLVALREGKLCALLPACVEGDTLWSHRGLTYGGWLMPLKHFDATVMIDVMDAACQWMSENGIKRLVYKPVPHIYHRYPCEEDLYALFRHQARTGRATGTCCRRCSTSATAPVRSTPSTRCGCCRAVSPKTSSSIPPHSTVNCWPA